MLFWKVDLQYVSQHLIVPAFNAENGLAKGFVCTPPPDEVILASHLSSSVTPIGLRDEKDHLELKRLADQVFEQVADVVSVLFHDHSPRIKVVNHLCWLVLLKVLVVCIVKPVYLVKGDVPFLQF